MYYADHLWTTEDYKRIFRRNRLRGMEKVSISTLAEFFVLKFNITHNAIIAILNDYNTQKDHSLNEKDFLFIVGQLNRFSVSELANRFEFFELCDKDHDGYISGIDICNGYRKKPSSKISFQLVVAMLNAFDVNEDGNFNFIDFNYFQDELLYL